MKTFFRFSLFLLLLSPTLLLNNGCKRGPDDPWFSIYTRDQRLEGGWHLRNYVLTADATTLTNTTFNTTACDTGNIGGLKQDKITRSEEMVRDTLVNATIINSISGTPATVVTYDMYVVYNLDIDKKGTYVVDGTYSFLDASQNILVDGSFTSERNTWYWEESNHKKEAVSFRNFPLIDASMIATTGKPVKYIDRQTFDIVELRDKEMRFVYANTETANNFQVFDPYPIYLPTDTLNDCLRQVTTTFSNKTDGEWQFKR